MSAALLQSDVGIDGFVESVAFLARRQRATFDERRLRDELLLASAVTPLRLAEALDAQGVMLTVLSVSFETMRSAALPAILRVDGRFLVAVAASRREIIVEESAVEGGGRHGSCRKRHRLRRDDFPSRTDGTLLAIEFLGAEFPGTAPLFATLRSLLARFAGPLANRFFLSLIVVALGLVGPHLLQRILDALLGGARWPALLPWISASAALAAAGVLVGYAQARVAAEVGGRIDYTLASLLHHRFFRRPGGAGAERAATLSVAAQELTNFRHLITSIPEQSLLDAVAVVAYAAALLSYDGRLGLLALIALPVLVGLQCLSMESLRRGYEESVAISERLTSVFSERVAAVTDVKAYGAETATRQALETESAGLAEQGRRLARQSAKLAVLMRLAIAAIQVGGLILSCRLVLSGELSAGGALAVNLYLAGLLTPIGSLSAAAPSWQQLRVTTKKVAEALAVEKGTKGATASRLQGSIVAENLGFRYATSERSALQAISFSVRAGEVVAIVGPNGSGKSTLARLLAGLVEATEGRLLIDGIESAALSPASRAQQGALLQDGTLFSGSVAENIAFADDAPDAESLRRALDSADAAAFIDALPGGMETSLAEGGLGLSGGQRQRVMLARLLYRNPKIVVLDEPTAALDGIAESRVIDGLRETFAGRTIFLVTHRQSTLQFVDRVLYLRDGHLVEEGHPAALFATETYLQRHFAEPADAAA